MLDPSGHAGGPLRLCLDDVAADELLAEPALDTAISRALLHRVEAGELPATLRLSRPARVLAFSTRDARVDGFDDAVAAARSAGFTPVVRLAGGKAAVFTPATIAFAWALPTARPGDGIEARFERMARALRDAARALGCTHAAIGEVAGEYCPGAWSVNDGRGRKLAGVGQRLTRRAAHTGGVLVVDDAELVVDVLIDVYAALDYDWDPAATGAIASSAGPTTSPGSPGAAAPARSGTPAGSTDAALTVDAARLAVADAFATTHELEPWPLDRATLELARRFVHEHHL